MKTVSAAQHSARPVIRTQADAPRCHRALALIRSIRVARCAVLWIVAPPTDVRLNRRHAELGGIEL
jgi:hypothetical protein